MYKRDVAEIKDFVRFNGPDALVSVVLFVLLTIPVSYTHLTLPTTPYV